MSTATVREYFQGIDDIEEVKEWVECMAARVASLQKESYWNAPKNLFSKALEEFREAAEESLIKSCGISHMLSFYAIEAWAWQYGGKAREEEVTAQNNDYLRITGK